jgi:L-amino acid N-acyltransferase YncA
MIIRRAEPQDYESIWQIFHAVVAEGDTYAFAPDTPREEALKIWVETPQATFVAEDGDQIVGTYYIKPNQPGLGNHVANAGFMVPERGRGAGVGRAMGEHAVAAAKEMGFRAMQFNYVVASNTGAVKLWRRLGFDIIGTVPKAFRLRDLELVDVLIMHREL